MFIAFSESEYLTLSSDGRCNITTLLHYLQKIVDI